MQVGKDDAQSARVGADDLGALEEQEHEGEKQERRKPAADPQRSLRDERVQRLQVLGRRQEGHAVDEADQYAADDEREQYRAEELGKLLGDVMGPGRLLGEGLADEPSRDQHHTLDAEGDHQREHGLVGEVAHAVPGRVARG